MSDTPTSPSELRRERADLENPVPLPADDERLSIDEAASALGVREWFVRVLANTGYLEPVRLRSDSDQIGVSLRSVDAEKSWRSQAGFVRRCGRVLFLLVRNI